jgi:hypothetical protein
MNHFRRVHMYVSRLRRVDGVCAAGALKRENVFDYA